MFGLSLHCKKIQGNFARDHPMIIHVQFEFNKNIFLMKRKKDVSMFLMLNRGGGCITLPTEEDKKKHLSKEHSSQVYIQVKP
jgi:hypothetical protein